MNLVMKKFSGCGALALLFFAVMSVAPETAQGAMPDKVFLELCKKGTADEMRAALAAGIHVNARYGNGVTALMWAAGNNPDPEVVKTLLECGADVNVRTRAGRTALMYAARENANPEVAKALLAGGADVHARDNELGVTALIWAAAKNSNPEVVKALLEGGADVNARDNKNWGLTALMAAAGNNSNPEVVKMLLENGADAHAVDKDGDSAIWWAQKRKHGDKEKILQILKEYASSVR